MCCLSRTVKEMLRTTVKLSCPSDYLITLEQIHWSSIDWQLWQFLQFSYYMLLCEPSWHLSRLNTSGPFHSLFHSNHRQFTSHLSAVTVGCDWMVYRYCFKHYCMLYTRLWKIEIEAMVLSGLVLVWIEKSLAPCMCLPTHLASPPWCWALSRVVHKSLPTGGCCLCMQMDSTYNWLLTESSSLIN